MSARRLAVRITEVECAECGTSLRARLYPVTYIRLTKGRQDAAPIWSVYCGCGAEVAITVGDARRAQAA